MIFEKYHHKMTIIIWKFNIFVVTLQRIQLLAVELLTLNF